MKRFLVLLALAAPVWSDRVEFRTFPPGYVWEFKSEDQSMDYLGPTNEYRDASHRSGKFGFDFKKLADGTKSRDGVAVTPRDFDPKTGRFNRTIYLTLTPAEWAGYIASQPFLYVLLAGLGGGVWGVRRWRRRVQEALEKSQVVQLFPPKVGRFDIEEVIGRGGCGEVYRATDDRGQPVAVKLMLPEISHDENSKKRFLREVQICSQLNHPNIIQLYDWGEQDGRLYLAMELMRGETLGERLRRAGLLTPAQLALLLPQMTGALWALHERGLVHRDVKPDNMFLTANNRLKLMDFGIALGQDLTRATHTGVALGTPTYMAPEQVKGQVHPASDQYALGVLAFIVLTGQKPFDAADPVALAYMHIHQDAPRPSQFVPELPERVDIVIGRMLAKQPELRFPNIQIAGQALVEALQTQGATFFDDETQNISL